MLQLLAERRIGFGPCYFSTPSFHHIPPKTDAVQGQNTLRPTYCFSGNMKSGKSLRCFISQFSPIVLVGGQNPNLARFSCKCKGPLCWCGLSRGLLSSCTLCCVVLVFVGTRFLMLGLPSGWVRTTHMKCCSRKKNLCTITIPESTASSLLPPSHVAVCKARGVTHTPKHEAINSAGSNFDQILRVWSTVVCIGVLCGFVNAWRCSCLVVSAV